MGRLSNSGDCFGVWLQYCVVVVLCTLVVLTDSVKSALYTNQLAVHIEGGPQEAHRIAKRHGFINLGQIGDLEDHYLFEHPHIVKRSTSISHEHHKKLNDESQVRWLEQQVVLSRKKRGFTEEKYTMNDPNWSDQWYLHRAKHLDMNVIPVWKKGYSGKGVVITILDDGIERNHADLVQNYDGQASYDINGRDADPMPRYDSTNENRHGTRCAGEVSASANNSVCGVGIAFESSIGGVRMLDGDVTDAVEAAALSLNPQHIDIYSASWGPDDDGRVVDGPGRLAKQSFINGITKGRNGLGSIFVWASGNGGNAHDSCNCDGYTNSIFTLSVSSTSESGSKPWYLEECSSTLATTYSSGGYREKQIVTTDLHNLCTKSHTGTSAAAPLAAGIVALVLEANPKLTWRDVQYITLLTARNDVFKDADWSVNSLGRKVSLKYGYGLMDSSAMVDLAETWTNVPQQHTCEKPADTSDVPLSGTPYSTTIVSDGCSSQANAIKYLEHVQINATLSYSRRGDISLKLTSPRGTTSTLLPKRQNDRNVGKFDNWPFMSVHFWGEDPTGTWTLEVRNEGVLSNHGMLSSWSLRLHGTATDPLSKSLTPHTDASPGTADLATTKPIITCHTECLDTCKGPNSQDCDSCKHYRVDNTGHCVENCSITYYTDQTNKTCYKCDSTCQTCDGPKSTQCGSCFGGWFLMTENNTCVMECAEGYFEEDPSGRCTSCDPSCLACQGSAKICTSCHDDKSLHDGVCLSSNECRGNEFKNQQGICEQCHIVCGTCTGPLLHDCLSCVSDDALTTYLQENTCVTQCGPEYYLSHPNDIQHPTCHRCHPSCKHCFGPTAADCGSCEDRLSLVNGKCVPSSPEPCPPDATTTTTVATTTTTQPGNTTKRSDVQCGSEFITVEIPMNLLPGIGRYSLQDPTCLLTTQGGKLRAEFGHTECGTVARFTDDAIVYKNSLYIEKTNESIPIVCEYPRRKSLSISYKPVQRNVRFYEKNFGVLDITMRQYSSDSFSNEIHHTSYPVSVKPDEPVYIKVEASSLAVFPGSCLATSSQTPHDATMSRELIKNGCKTDPSVVIYPSTDGKLRFSFNAFSFAPQIPVVYVHCEVLLCDASDLASECHQGCTGTVSRTKRSLVTAAREGHFVSGGPLVVDDKRSITDSSLDAILVAVATVSMIVAVVSVMVAVITLQMKQTNTPNSTTD